MEDEFRWLTTAQLAFATTTEEDELTNEKDVRLGKMTARGLHPATSSFINRLHMCPHTSIYLASSY